MCVCVCVCVKRVSSGVVVNTLDADIVVNEFALQSCNFVCFQTNTLRKGMNPLIPAAMG